MHILSRRKDRSDPVLHCQGGKPLDRVQEERIARDNERPGVAPGKTCIGGVELIFAAGPCENYIDAKAEGRRQHAARVGLAARVVGIDQGADDCGARNKVVQDSHLLLQELRGSRGVRMVA